MSSNPYEQDERLDPRVKRTRNLILQSFGGLLAEKSFDAISVQDITERAQINRATFYAHFEDKYALLDYSITQLFRQELDKRTLNACHYTPENLRVLILTVCEFLSRLHTDCAQPHPQFESLVETHSTEIPVTVATWAIYGLASFWSHSKKRPALEKFVDEALPLVAVNLEQFAQRV